jgi:hypothetical protein
MNLDSAVTNGTNKRVFSGSVVDRTVFPQPSFSHTDFLLLINFCHFLHLLVIDGWEVCYKKIEFNFAVAANNKRDE